jgi:hypothetical protein
MPLDVAQTVVQSSKPAVSYVRKGARFAEIIVEAMTQTVGLKIRPRGAIDDPNNQLFRHPPNAPEPSSPFVAAYGSQRGSSLGKGRFSSGDSSLYASVSTLFHESSELVSAEEWLKSLDYQAVSSNSREARSELELARRAIQGLLPGSPDIDVGPTGVTVKGPDGAVPLSAMSDGYLTTIGWAVDLMARWSQHQKQQGVGTPSLDPSMMEGVVLLDEIDLHLHPKWQAQIIQQVRTVFPRMTFVVTTHSALTVLSARPGELHVLERESDTENIRMLQKDIRPGMTADEILTGEWFDLSATTDPDTLDKLQEYADMLRAGMSEEDPKRRTLEAELRRRLGGFAATSAERIAQSVAAEVIQKDVRQLSSEERSQAREKILTMTKDRFRDQ